MKKLAIGLALGALPLSAFAGSNTDWTPFFKTWENGCDNTQNTSRLFDSLLPDYEHWGRVYVSQKRNEYKPQHLVLPQKYRSAVTQGIRIVYNGREFNYTWHENLFQSKIKVIGKYYGMPMEEIGIFSVMETGIYMPYFIINTPYNKAKSILKQKAKIKKGYSEFGDNPYPEMEIFKHPKLSSKTVVMCDTSN
ncbi:hypothetical protein ACFBZI_00410 [Moraxella sp. ZJ142]|uniref:hypothetical protein n=1 Tax=Moraxella marmotae TaxID=3344520 RepID=UPI0035D46241